MEPRNPATEPITTILVNVPLAGGQVVAALAVGLHRSLSAASFASFSIILQPSTAIIDVPDM